jgi:hypothetical protein
MVSLPEHYQRPGWSTTNVFTRLVAALMRLGVSVYGSRVLEVKGRKSGEWRQTPVNLLQYESADYLVAPRGQTQWVKNLRASGEWAPASRPADTAVYGGRAHRRREAAAATNQFEKVEIRGRGLLRRGRTGVIR